MEGGGFVVRVYTRRGGEDLTGRRFNTWSTVVVVEKRGGYEKRGSGRMCEWELGFQFNLVLVLGMIWR